MQRARVLSFGQGAKRAVLTRASALIALIEHAFGLLAPPGPEPDRRALVLHVEKNANRRDPFGRNPSGGRGWEQSRRI